MSRPKIETRTLSLADSGWISEIVAGMPSNGPSVTVMDSPTAKAISIGAPFATAVAAFSLAFVCCAGASIEMTSGRVSGTGECAWPTKPVTPGVCRTAPHDSSVRSIRTRT